MGAEEVGQGEGHSLKHNSQCRIQCIQILKVSVHNSRFNPDTDRVFLSNLYNEDRIILSNPILEAWFNSPKGFTERGFHCFSHFQSLQSALEKLKNIKQTLKPNQIDQITKLCHTGHNQSQCLGRQVAPTREQRSPGRDLDRGLHQVNSQPCQ